MADWNKVEAQLRKTIDDMNEATGSNDTNIVDGVDRLIRGYGGAASPNLQDKTITENGSYTADSGYDGLGTVTVNVESGGGNSSGWNSQYYGTFKVKASEPTFTASYTIE